jgi:PhoH-like ATPase
MVSERKKTFVLDTNVLLHDPRALFGFDEHDVVIPMTVIEEIDKFKKNLDEVGRNARAVSRALDELRAMGSLREGVASPGGGVLRVVFQVEAKDRTLCWGGDTNDDRILQTALGLQHNGTPYVVLVTRDTNMRLKGDALGLATEDHKNAQIEVDEQYTGAFELEVPDALIDALNENGHVALPDGLARLPHEFLVLQSATRAKNKALGRVDATGRSLQVVGRHREGVWGITARNKEQLFALDLLLDDTVHLVTLSGMAGTGKTLLAIACALRQVADESKYRRLLVSRPIFPLGRDIGYLPGDLDQKLNPWMKPVFDNLDLLLSSKSPKRGQRSYTQLFEQNIIQVEPLTYIRGRSIPQQFIIVDEAQNLTPHEVKTVLTRAGEGTKVVMTGDPNQVDHPYVDALSNGLTYTIERFKHSAIAGHVTLRKGERSALAELAAKLL